MITLLALASAFASDLTTVVAADHRDPAHVARDVHRNPVETLTFFGIKQDMHVVEIHPSGGYYTEILAPFLADNGGYTAAIQGLSTTGGRRYSARTLAKLGEHERYEKTVLSTFSPSEMAIAAPASADLVLTFRNVHGWTGWPDNKVQDAFNHFFEALKPGGALGVVDHRLPEDRATDTEGGYIKTSAVQKLAESAGFVLEGQSEVNANPRDTADYEKGVWTLPPSFRLGDTDREKYAAIGESDRMTLLFRKPATAAPASAPAPAQPPKKGKGKK